MVRQPFVLLAVAFEHLAPLAGKGADDLLGAFGIRAVLAFEEEKITAVAHALPVGHRERRFAHRQEINRVEHIGLARAVVPDQAVDVRAERKLLLRDVLEIEQR